MSPELDIPNIASRYPDVVMAQSTRLGGVSQGAYSSLNLGLYTADAPEDVKENRRRFWEFLGISESQTAGGFQIHGSEILKVETPGNYEGFDAFVTNIPGLFLTVTIADCVPVLLFDPVRKAVGAVHAGWRGTVAQIAAKTVESMSREFGTAPEDCLAFIGACIGFDAFEVGSEVAAEFAPNLKKASGDKFLVDLKTANKLQLLEAGLSDISIEVFPECTYQNTDRYFSYRKEGGVTGRMLAVIGITE